MITFAVFSEECFPRCRCRGAPLELLAVAGGGEKTLAALLLRIFRLRGDRAWPTLPPGRRAAVSLRLLRPGIVAVSLQLPVAD